jgi:hypothetical protein
MIVMVKVMVIGIMILGAMVLGALRNLPEFPAAATSQPHPDNSEFLRMVAETGCKSQYDDETKANLYTTNYENRTMTVTGEVTYIKGDNVGLKILPTTITNDILIMLADPWTVIEGQHITVSFMVSSQGGCFLSYSGEYGTYGDDKSRVIAAIDKQGEESCAAVEQAQEKVDAEARKPRGTAEALEGLITTLDSFTAHQNVRNIQDNIDEATLAGDTAKVNKLRGDLETAKAARKAQDEKEAHEKAVSEAHEKAMADIRVCREWKEWRATFAAEPLTLRDLLPSGQE